VRPSHRADRVEAKLVQMVGGRLADAD